ncbi:uncharacterized protein EV422DRAFT_570333 [Fimicolochytrium jonesii]|uniref:uncharacterized protein n=1 Tax=Fimicolochytrium jonesii TaxID=1396493 RepID=UPI0022FEA2FF|nr:uncharacterized protein EV422DRAFT_570333 [Fimicolochytrium jonesii]KAI8817858.1 hypothetical protein EV422DRAFT_570333 [Fimicolochytrium jonesii]
MFIERVAELGLLEHAIDTNILSAFPLPTRLTLISSVTSCLLPNSTLVAAPPALLTSAAHVRWAMEVVGQGFALPIEEWGVIRACLGVYASWLGGGNGEVGGAPVAIGELTGTEVEQRFWQTIFEQLSLLFQPRSPTLPTTAAATSPPPSFPAPLAPPPNLGSATDPTDLLSIHVDLCHTALSIISTAARQLGEEFSEETWIVLLKVMLGVADCLLGLPVGSQQPSHQHGETGRGNEREREKREATDLGTYGPRMADALCQHLIRVLIELWLRAGVRRVYMWDCLKKYFTTWTHRLPILHQWNATILGLTKRVVGLLYGTNEGAERVVIDVDENYNVTLVLDTEFVYYAWHRTIYLIGDPNALLAANFEVAVKGIGAVVHVWHRIGGDEEPADRHTPGVPDGSTLLHMFGTWLFEATTKTGSDYSAGRAEALGILCRIFCQPQRRRRFERTYLERFYTAVKEGLRNDTRAITSILLNSGTLFARDLSGSRILVPDFVIALRRILPRPASHNTPAHQNAPHPQQQKSTATAVNDGILRRAAYTVIGCIIALPNHFESVPLSQAWMGYDKYVGAAAGMGVGKGGEDALLLRTIKAMYANSEDPQVGGEDVPLFKKLKAHLAEMLIASLTTEHSPPNARYILHLVNNFVAEDVAFCPGLPALVIRVVQEKPIRGWPPDVARTAFQTLNTLSHFYQYIWRDNKNCPRELVLSLCRYVDQSLLEDNLVAAQPLIIAAYDCLVRWVTAGDWITDDKECHRAVIATLCRGIGLLDREDEFAAVSPPNTYSGLSPQHSSSLTASSTVGNLSQLASGGVGIGIAAYGVETGGGDKKKGQRHTIAASKLIPKLRGSAAPSAAGSVSTGTKDAGLGLPTFANLTAELTIKGAAEMALAHMVNHLGHFPPYGEVTGVAKVSSMWDEEGEVGRIVAVREALGKRRRRQMWADEFGARDGSSDEDGDEDGNASSLTAEEVAALPTPKVTLADYRKYMRFYAYEKRIIIGIVETPHWAVLDDPAEARKETASVTGRLPESGRTSSLSRPSAGQVSRLGGPKRLTPYMTLVLRDATGKYTWMSSLRYVEEDYRTPDTTMDQPPSAAETTADTSVASLPAQTDAPSETPGSPQPPKITISSDSRHGSAELGTCSSSSTDDVHHASAGDITSPDQSIIPFINASNAPASPVSPQQQTGVTVQTSTSRSRHFVPAAYPYTPKGASVVHYKCVNETSIPALDDVLGDGDTDRKGHEVIKKVTQNQIQMEQEWADNVDKSGAHLPQTTAAIPPAPVDLTDPHTKTPNAFRIFLSQFGLLKPDLQSRLWPLTMTDALLEELKRVDKLPERDCMSISVLFCRSSNDSVDEILHRATVSNDFDEFMHCLGWPVDLATHVGFKGALSSSIADTAPYFASKHVEMVFHCPYYIRRAKPLPGSQSSSSPAAPALSHTSIQTSSPQKARSTSPQRTVPRPLGVPRERPISHPPARISAASSAVVKGTPAAAGLVPELDPTLTKEHATSASHVSLASSVSMSMRNIPTSATSEVSPSSSSASKPPTTSHASNPTHPHDFLTHLTHDDVVTLIWIEDIYRLSRIQQRLVRAGSLAQIYIFVHPLPHAPGLYWIRILPVGGVHPTPGSVGGHHHHQHPALASLQGVGQAGSEDLTKIGPLMDGMIISRHTLGTLVRATAQRAHKHCKALKMNYRRPTLIRRHDIEGLCNKHKASLSLGRFYADLFT